MKQRVFTFDASRCSGCMACVVACQDQNDLVDDTTAFRRVTRLEEGKGDACSLNFLSLSCLHCEDAPCVMVCPACAITKDDEGVVAVNREICIGCHSCELACPVGAPKFAEDGKMEKCDFCIDRIKAGMEPACVRVCTTRALSYGFLDEEIEKKVKSGSVKILKALLDPQTGKETG